MIRSSLLIVFLSFLSLSVQATTVEINPGTCDLGVNCSTTPANPGNGDDYALFSPTLDGLALLYKAESSDTLSSTPVAELGSLASSYTTMFVFTTADEYTGAMITYDGGDSVDCSTNCYLVVKDGLAHDPSAYLFDLSLNPFNWDGVMKLNLTDFWPGGGSISHVAIYGEVSPVPVPAAVWLFGTALIGFIGMSRRTKV
jgi:hypothetical protein